MKMRERLEQAVGNVMHTVNDVQCRSSRELIVDAVLVELADTRGDDAISDAGYDALRDYGNRDDAAHYVFHAMINNIRKPNDVKLDHPTLAGFESLRKAGVPTNHLMSLAETHYDALHRLPSFNSDVDVQEAAEFTNKYIMFLKGFCHG